MKRPRPLPRITRRDFLRRNAGYGGLIGLLAVMSGSRRIGRGATATESNPFAYDVGKLAKTDPRLIQYKEVARFRSPRETPRRLAIGPDGHLYVAAGNYLSVLGTDGRAVTEFALSNAPRCAAIAQDRTVYIGFRDHLELYDAQGSRKAAWDSPGGRPWFTGLAVGENDLFAADAGNRVVLRYDRSGKLVRRIGEKNKERNIPGFVVPSPYLDVDLHRDGLLRVNNPGRHRMELYTVEGDFELAWGKPSAAIGGFCGCCNPINFALLPDGRCITCEKGLPRVKVYRADGEFESVVAGPETFPENARVGAGEGTGDAVKAGLDAVVDAQERIYILDYVTGAIHVMARKTRPA